mmetsp:Transcript_7625/g.9978  ORF Transcript_7625/g.9978 Transcript_7625/m.9978 type:complete len:201 (+) Transcript_7625:95-697(+)|eukprot:CAMPEP_0198136958 /NCGR_PEP_ID=MMETSP1443-20131203/513_1 /TAXON_ID=186043 /ORGANISM="Entomoneis sp., Strain CCMP2396" /LENGTH=200 /DNA_ID=CAMNT_0043798267 /DNA_START=49 /DNA_END=651 /DNA_ORIENTATION=-
MNLSQMRVVVASFFGWISICSAFVVSHRGGVIAVERNHLVVRLAQSAGDDKGEADDNADEQTPPLVETSTIRIDDGGSNMTGRFKYKVNALMGAFDPADASQDTEHISGNILNAMLKFPVKYTFSVVGKTAGNETLQKQFESQVQSVILQETGEASWETRIIPRGSNFTKLSVSVEVQSSEMIAAIYKGLEGIEISVMQF